MKITRLHLLLVHSQLGKKANNEKIPSKLISEHTNQLNITEILNMQGKLSQQTVQQKYRFSINVLRRA